MKLTKAKIYWKFLYYCILLKESSSLFSNQENNLSICDTEITVHFDIQKCTPEENGIELQRSYYEECVAVCVIKIIWSL